MARLRAVFARIRLPVFSVKHPETFQVMSCLPIPQPSSLVGALAYCIGVYRGSGIKTFHQLRESIGKEVGLLARAKLTDMTTISTIVLRRFRIADEFRKRMELYELLSKGDYTAGKFFLEKDLTDAFYRSYIMGHEILCVWVVSGDLEVYESMFLLLQRLGDTESLVAVREVWIEEAEIGNSSEIKTPFPFPLEDATIKRGDFVLMKMCNEKRLIEQFVIPVKHELRYTERGKVVILKPTEVEAIFPQPVPYCETSEGTIILSRGG